MIRQIWTTAVLLQAIVTGFSPVARLPSIQQRQQQQQTVNRPTTLYMARINRNSRAPPVLEKKPPMNDEITAPELRVLTPNSKGKDEPLGVLSLDEALEKAKEMGDLDLILVNPNSDPPVCKIVDYSKYRYMQEKKAKEVKKNSKATEIKEVKMSYKIDVHDYEVRKKNAVKFLKQGNRVKCTVMFRGREVQHENLGLELLDKLATDMEEVCVRESKAKREGRSMAMIVSPRPEVLKTINDNRRALEKEKKKKKSAEKSAAKQEKEAASAAAAAAAAAAEANGASASSALDLESEGDDLADIEADIESSLDDLFGSDDLTDDLFS